MKAQAKRCTPKELAYLSHWRRLGFKLSIEDQIPLSTVTPPSLATRRPVLDALIALGIVQMGIGTLIGLLLLKAGFFSMFR